MATTSTNCDKKVLVIGDNQNEYVICRELSHSMLVSEIFALPGSNIINKMPKCLSIDTELNTDDLNVIAGWCVVKHIDLVVVGPTEDWATEFVNIARASGIRCFGPGAMAEEIDELNLPKFFNFVKI